MEAVTATHPYFEQLMAAARVQGPVTVGLAHACDRYPPEAASTPRALAW